MDIFRREAHSEVVYPFTQYTVKRKPLAGCRDSSVLWQFWSLSLRNLISAPQNVQGFFWDGTYPRLVMTSLLNAFPTPIPLQIALEVRSLRQCVESVLWIPILP